MSQEIIFTTLPHKKIIKDGKSYLQLSVFTSIKLQTPTDTNLGAFDDILNWSEKIRDADFKFKLKNGKVLDAELNKTILDVDLYKNIFHKNIKVDDFKEEDFSRKKFYSAPILHVKDFIIKNIKSAAITSPKTLVSADKFIDVKEFGAISRFQLNEKEIENAETLHKEETKKKSVLAKNLMLKKDDGVSAIKKDLINNKFVPFSSAMSPASDFVQLRQFHKVDREKVESLNLKIKKPVFEFHDIMAVINSYPQIMRKLGFVLDFLIPYETSIPAKGTIKLVPDALNLDEANTIVSIPATAYELTAKGFYVSDKPDTIFKQGFVKINSNEFSVIQVDADGAALKTSNMTENKVQQIAKFYEARSKVGGLKKDKSAINASKLEFVEPPEDEGLPYMRTSGIAITKNGMAEHLSKSIKLNEYLKIKFKEAPVKKIDVKQKIILGQTPLLTTLQIKEPEVVLYSNEIVQGYRMDIAYKEQPTKWHSLHQKKDTYTWFNEENQSHAIENIKSDEGFIQLGVAQDPDDEDDVFVSETLARWEGWSLSVHKPGFAINDSEDYKLKLGETEKKDFVYKDKNEELKKYTFDPDLEFKINATSEIVAGSLPKLRFGKDYNIRVRTVDLAGNSVDLDFQSEAPQITSRKNIRYLRYEPLASPIVLVGNELKDGEFLERMVIRSNFDQTSVDYEDSNPVGGKFFDEFSQRYLLPPKNSQLIAETHGMFEKAFENNPVAAQKIYKIITNHEGLYQQAEPNKERIYKPSEVEIIYLPDPMAAGVSLFVAEGYENTHTQDFKAKMFSFFSNSEINMKSTNGEIPEDWYNAGVIRIRLEEGASNVKWNAKQRIFTVFLPKGHRTRIKFSTFWREKDLNKLSALWDLIQQDAPGNLVELRKLAESGQHWIVSPSREMELVHAVQQPVNKPEILAIYPDRDYNQTFVNINTRFDIHGESTEKVEFQAKWVDPLDDGISVDIKEKVGTNSTAEIPIQYHDDKITKGTIPASNMIVNSSIKQLELKPKLQFTKITETQFKVDPQPDAKKVNTLYKSQLVKFEKFKKEKSAPKISMVNRLKLDILEPKFSFVNELNYRIKPLEQHFGDTKHRWVDYKLNAVSRYREYFDKILTANPNLNTMRESDWVEKVNILSSARPDVPEIDYIIPTFEWKKTTQQTKIIHERLGGGLRIFIKRPWFSSGADEKLAILIPSKNSTFTIVGRSMSYIQDYTNWGIDPLLFAAKPSNNSPDIQNFRHSPEIDEDLAYPDDSNKKVTAVAYPVHFDVERQLWYCDIALDSKQMYFPFIKLVLARYQKHSVRKNNTDVCLSPSVASDMIQLVPERKTTVSFVDTKQKSTFNVQVTGTLFNEKQVAVNGNKSFVRISFLDGESTKPISGIIDPASKSSVLDKETVTININTSHIKNNIYTISKNLKLPTKYNNTPFKILIEEYERGPSKMNIDSAYKNRLEQSEETDRLIYADVFEVN
ncbi:hypothetical protein MHL31_09605 [Lutibacter sp. A80]|uniref:hypothetical protein n=1 Tax=Lutibacter sp. A80 TaxID=2918453 RepID=UPI001F0681D7|nr:hypothetical protein [Lutibacter sp. A80]UMB59335.1 hypothetical protein MHL31_09605 [Lutibacter sp. A80]